MSFSTPILNHCDEILIPNNAHFQEVQNAIGRRKSRIVDELETLKITGNPTTRRAIWKA